MVLLFSLFNSSIVNPLARIESIGYRSKEHFCINQ
jgi:hypothetical protein